MTATTRPAEFDKAIASATRFLRSVSWRFVRTEQDSQDLVQETILRALSNWQSYRPGTNIKTWLLWRMKYVFRDSRRKGSIDTVDIENFDAADNTEREGGVIASVALKRLKDTRDERALVRLGMGCTLEELGEEMGVSRQRAKQITDVARSQFAKRVGYKVRD